MAATQETWFHYATTDAQLLGVLTWVGLLITIAGFWVAIWQIRKVRKASVAATHAVSGLVRVVRSQEQSARIVNALEHLTAAQNMMKQKNQDAASAHLSVSWTSLVHARELSDEAVDRERLSDYVFSTRRLLDNVNSPANAFPPSQKVSIDRHVEISNTISGLGEMSARLSALLTGIGANP